MTASFETETRRAELWINAALMGEFKKRVDRMNRRAVKLGLEGVSFQVLRIEEVSVSSETVAAFPVTEHNRTVYHALYNVVEVTGPMPKLNGYRFVATVDLTGSMPLVRAQPFAVEDFNVDLTKYRTTDCRCEHCNTIRKRNDVLVVQNIESGDTMQIGRNCAADFFRSENAHGLLAVSDWVSNLSGSDLEGDIGNARVEPIISLQRLFEMAAAVVRTFGWVSTSMARQDSTLTSTRGRVAVNLFPWAEMPTEYRATVTEADKVEAQAVIDWLLAEFVGKDAAACSDFEHNVVAAIEEPEGAVPFVRAKNMNYLIWAINGYTRHLEKKEELERRERAKAQARAVSTHVGSVGERLVFKVKLVFRKGLDSAFGRKYLCKFEDADGNLIIWWSSSDTAYRLVLQEAYIIKGTVKAHNTYEEVAQTLLTRVAVLEGALKDDD